MPCEDPFKTNHVGSGECPAVQIGMSYRQKVAIFLFLSALYLCTVGCAGDRKFAAFMVMLCPIIDVGSDFYVLLNSKFFNVVVFAVSVTCFTLPNFLFLFELLELAALNNVYPAILPRPLNEVIPDSHRLACMRVVLLVPYYILGTLFWVVQKCLWLALGVFLFQTKVMAICTVRKSWFKGFYSKKVFREANMAVEYDRDVTKAGVRVKFTINLENYKTIRPGMSRKLLRKALVNAFIYVTEPGTLKSQLRMPEIKQRKQANGSFSNFEGTNMLVFSSNDIQFELGGQRSSRLLQK